ncbi:MAG: hypothetical protein KDA20_11635 [Phycisphaerales bacterium]|nr:hypothetical protein [Phycisphaerales bacterium]
MMRVALLLLTMVFAGCGGATRSVSFRVMDLRDGDAQPLVGAKVRVVAMDAGMAPLPVTKRTLNESKYAKARTVAFSDRDGIVRLDVLGDRGAWIEVERAPVGDGAERADEVGQVWRWRWEPRRGALEAEGGGAGWSVGLERPD